MGDMHNRFMELWQDCLIFSVIAYALQTIPKVSNPWVNWAIIVAQYFVANLNKVREARAPDNEDQRYNAAGLPTQYPPPPNQPPPNQPDVVD
jgi:hypothetical protein